MTLMINRILHLIALVLGIFAITLAVSLIKIALFEPSIIHMIFSRIGF